MKRARDLYQRHSRWIPIAFFLAGFVFDTFMLRRIDELATIIQQAVYLFVSILLIGVELIESTREIQPPYLLKKVWKYRENLLHFLLGTLLNCYTIFYFKSASALTSFFFIAFLVILLGLNEFKKFGESQARVHVAFWSLCLVSYLVALSPILLGFIGTIPFLIATLASIFIFFLVYKAFRAKLADNSKLLKTHVLCPFVAIEFLFVSLYFAHVIPPVPLSVTYMGIFHDIQRAGDGYVLSYTRPQRKFWQHGDQTFLARPGDTIFCFVKVFSPTRFKDQLQVRWLYEDERMGWTSADAIPMPIVGGREEGFRGVTKKSNYQPGRWRVQIETREGHEIGWIGFTVEKDESTDERNVKTVVQ